jgi:hypothetical protein
MTVDHDDRAYLENLVRDVLWLCGYQNEPANEDALREHLEEHDGIKLLKLCLEAQHAILEVGASGPLSCSSTGASYSTR